MHMLRRMVDYFYRSGAFELDEDDPGDGDLGYQATG